MSKNLRWKWIFIVAVVLSCVFGVIGLPKSTKELTENWTKNIRLGLDLKGGSHIVLQIQVQDAFKAEADQVIERLKEPLRKESVEYVSIDRNEPASIETAGTIQINVRGVPIAKASDFRRIVNDLAGQQWVLASENSTDYKLTMRGDAALKLRQDTLTQSMSTIEKKVNGLGVAEASVQQRGGSSGESEILIQLPGVDDPARVKGILQTSALLELCEVKSGPFESQDAARSANGGVLPLGTKLVRGSSKTGDGNGDTWWLLGRSPVVTGRDVRNARAQQDATNRTWETSFVLSQEAASRFGQFTGSHIGQRLAIVLDNRVLTAPTVQSKISDSGVINNIGSQEDASDLALNLRAGSLPAGAKVIEERTVGPSLGADSIRRGVTAGIVGLALLIAAMVLYYRGAGFNAVLALLLNTIMTVAALSYIDATWTLPGIAGLVLSIGMAVDSNVLIFERIKEELRSGKAIPAAISSGFARAFATIIDTHVTTVVASAFLFIFGTGPVRGFAVTLVIGLIANVLTAVFVSRAIFDIELWKRPKMTHLSIGTGRTELFKATSIDFLSKRNLTLGLSMLAIVISVVSLAVKGGPKYGLDFRGGTNMYVRFDPKPPIEELRSTLSSRLKGDFSLQETQGTGEFIIGTELANEEKLDEVRQTVEQTLREKYANLGGKLDLNNANQAALEDRVRRALPSLAEQDVKDLATRVLTYRDKERNGLVGNLEELSKVPGVNPQVLAALKQELGVGTFNIRSVEVVGPRAGQELRQQALLATVCALGGMLIYVAFRFKLISGAAAVIATIHDVVITLGLFSLTGREIDLTVIAALLTLIGYSMNDKIVVLDRVRENLRAKYRGSFLDLVNQSINQTLSRTILTAGLTLLACLSLYFLGGKVLNGIAFALCAGIVVGTYSSIFVASALLVMWHQFQERREAPAAGTRPQPKQDVAYDVPNSNLARALRSKGRPQPKAR
ncbi:MAG: protein translocase subunit SecD [Acidobacteriia bacterium]|nr:protein translocase subunit SecD [Terriglobia bacterium]